MRFPQTSELLECVRETVFRATPLCILPTNGIPCGGHSDGKGAELRAPDFM